MGAGGWRAFHRPRHPDSLSHPLTRAVRRALPHPVPRAGTAYLSLLDRRLAALAECALGREASAEDLGVRAEDRAVATRFLEPLEGTWHDGDENLVRGYLDRWVRPGQDAAVAAARALIDAAGALAAMGARAEALWFYLWQLETMLESVAARARPRRGGH
jgi:hypothetical protein